LLEVLLLTLLCGEYAGAARPETWLGRFFLLGGRLSCAASLSVVPGLLGLALAALVPARRTLAFLSGALWSHVLFLVYVDTRIWGIFRYHFNGLVWNVLTTPGADEAVHITTREKTVVLVVIALMIPPRARRSCGLAARRPTVAPGAAHAGGGAAGHGMAAPARAQHAARIGVYWADPTRDPRVMAYARVIPSIRA
jgi:hypothetical protein